MSKKRVVKGVMIAVLCVAILGILLLKLPWRTPVNLEMPCSEIAQDGTLISSGKTVTIKGWELKYLFRKESELVLESLMLPSFSTPAKTHSDAPLTLSRNKPSPYAAFGMLWDGTDFRGIYISLEEDWKTCLISLDSGDHYYACSLDGSVPVSEIVEIHKWILD